MNKNNLISFLDTLLKPYGFKKKGNNWTLDGDEISKLVNLQKSYYGNLYYVNYGFIIKDLELTTTTHVEMRLGSADKEQQKRITDLLNLEIDIESNQRLDELKKVLITKVIVHLQSINSKIDLLDELKKRPHLNDIPLIVKDYFNLGL